MVVIYLPEIGVNINESVLNWRMPRTEVRALLQSEFKEDNSVFDFDDDDDDPIISRRDIYKNLVNPGDMIFLSYNAADEFIEFEYHFGISVSMIGKTLKNDEPVDEIARWFSEKGYEVNETEPGNFFVPGLRFTFASAGSMGSDGDGLAYFYAAADVSHLTA